MQPRNEYAWAGDCSAGEAGPVSEVVTCRLRPAVLRDLARLPLDVSGSTAAAACIELARQVDDSDNSATSKSMCARVLVDTMAALRALVPDEPEGDKVEDIAARRAARLAGKPKASRKRGS